MTVLPLACFDVELTLYSFASFDPFGQNIQIVKHYITVMEKTG